MEILKYFKESNSTYICFELNEADWDEFVKMLPPEYRISYITDADLENRIKTFGSTKEKEWGEILPTEGSIKSGDFGEILAYLFFKERHKDKKVDGPRKWHWKQEKNVAAPYTDVILFSIKDKDKPSKDDLLISVESKMKATPSKEYHPIQAAIDGAEKDYVSRIANSLSWLRKKYKDESLKEGADKEHLKGLVAMIERFIKSETIGEYDKKIKAIAFIDKDLYDDEVKKATTIPTTKGLNLNVFAVSIKALKNVYENVFTEIPKL